MLFSCLDLLSHPPFPHYAILTNGVPVSYFAYFKSFHSYFNNKDHIINLLWSKAFFCRSLYQANWIRKVEVQAFSWLCTAVLIHLNESMDLINNLFDFFLLLKIRHLWCFSSWCIFSCLVQFSQQWHPHWILKKPLATKAHGILCYQISLEDRFANIVRKLLSTGRRWQCF